MSHFRYRVGFDKVLDFGVVITEVTLPIEVVGAVISNEPVDAYHGETTASVIDEHGRAGIPALKLGFMRYVIGIATVIDH